MLYNIVLIEMGRAKKIEVIKAVRSFTELGLKEAKDLVDSAPVIVYSGENLSEVRRVLDLLDEAGAVSELRESVIFEIFPLNHREGVDPVLVRQIASRLDSPQIWDLSYNLDEKGGPLPYKPIARVYDAFEAAYLRGMFAAVGITVTCVARRPIEAIVIGPEIHPDELDLEVVQRADPFWGEGSLSKAVLGDMLKEALDEGLALVLNSHNPSMLAALAQILLDPDIQKPPRIGFWDESERRVIWTK